MASGLAAPEGGAALALLTPARRRTTFGSWEDCDIPEEFPDSDGSTRTLQKTRRRDSEDRDTDVPDSEANTLSPSEAAYTLTPLSHMESPSFWPPADLDHRQKRSTRGTTLDFDDDSNDDIPDEWSVANPARCPYYHMAPKTTMEGRAVEQIFFAYGEEDEYDPRNPRYLQPADTQQVVESTARQLQQQIARLQSLLRAREKLEPASSTAIQTYKRVLEEMRADFADLGVELDPIEEPLRQQGCRLATMDVIPESVSRTQSTVSERKFTW
jgi:hypothetical protein